MSSNGKGSLFLAAGVGKRYTISGETASKYSGLEVEDALGKLIREEIQDPELLALLEEPTSVLELFSEDHEGRVTETPLSRADSWNRIMETMAQEECEISLARRHRGGKGRVRKGAAT